ncbi:hypothetical protein [Blastopirellula marina]|uniref:Uncharacterized protein n=1 Tax=Blastopirellula marina TaxID=124 RepID=A0A2S8F6S0_9BACT|nr:hypothetical protein [Blastopirellula marina]PQO27838.1 hypothetical protein C5Y98_26270 [Blastopirellula marina]PTL41573.1 hypothetical protein C5Y97_26285 [Blastopirellula marina]
MHEQAEPADQQAATVTTRPPGLLIAFSLVTVALCLWFAGWLLALVTTLSAQEGSAIGFLAALLGPGLVATQQYRGTFRANPRSARFCTVFFGVVALLLFLSTVMSTNVLLYSRVPKVETLTTMACMLGVVVFLTSTSVMNYFRWKQLVQAEQALQPVVKSPRFTLLEMMALMLGVGLVLGGAAFYSHFSQ